MVRNSEELLHKIRDIYRRNREKKLQLNLSHFPHFLLTFLYKIEKILQRHESAPSKILCWPLRLEAEILPILVLEHCIFLFFLFILEKKSGLRKLFSELGFQSLKKGKMRFYRGVQKDIVVDGHGFDEFVLFLLFKILHFDHF